MAQELTYAFFKDIGVCTVGLTRLREYGSNIINSRDGWLDYVRSTGIAEAPFYTALCLDTDPRRVSETEWGRSVIEGLGFRHEHNLLSIATMITHHYERHGIDAKYSSVLDMLIDKIEELCAAGDDRA